MYKIIFSVLLAFSFQSISFAQQVAVMEARVLILSGSAIEALQEDVVVINAHQLQNEQVTIGSFLMKTAPSSEIRAHIEVKHDENSPAVSNLTFKKFNVSNTASSNGEHLLSVNGEVNTLASARPSTESLSMVIDHF